jgi:hypothetical protein
VRRQLIEQKGYQEDELPTAETIATKLSELGYYPKKVTKSQNPLEPGEHVLAILLRRWTRCSIFVFPTTNPRENC